MGTDWDKKGRYLDDPAYRERVRVLARERMRRKTCRDSNILHGRRFRLFEFDEARITREVLAVSKSGAWVRPDGLVVTDSRYLHVADLAVAIGVSQSAFRGWVRDLLFPAPLCYGYHPSRPSVYSIDEALAYCRIFHDVLDRVRTARPFLDKPELTAVLMMAQARLRANLSTRR